jgi:hypothetical protein
MSTEEQVRILRTALEAVRDEHRPRTPVPPPGRNYLICIPCARIWPCVTRKTADKALAEAKEDSDAPAS